METNVIFKTAEIIYYEHTAKPPKLDTTSLKK